MIFNSDQILESVTLLTDYFVAVQTRYKNELFGKAGSRNVALDGQGRHK